MRKFIYFFGQILFIPHILLFLFSKEKEKPAPLSPEVKAFAQRTVHALANQSVTVLSGQAQLPLRPSKEPRLLLVVVAPDKHTWSAETFAPTVKMLRAAGFKVDVQHNLSFYAHKPQDQLGYDRIIFAFTRHPHDPIGSLQLQHDEALTAWMANALPREKVIAISYGDPYVTAIYTPRAQLRINAYYNIDEIQRAVVEVLTGKLRARAVSPFTLP